MTSPMVKTLIAMLLATLCFQAYGEFREWCIADSQAPEDVLRSAMAWACFHGADCTPIKLNQSCYYPNTVQDHASYAFNNYYQNFKNKGGSCFFTYAAITTTTDPSHDSCKFDYIS